MGRLSRVDGGGELRRRGRVGAQVCEIVDESGARCGGLGYVGKGAIVGHMASVLSIPARRLGELIPAVR